MIKTAQSTLRRAIIRAIPNYYACSAAEQERYRLNISDHEDFHLQQELLRTLFDINIKSKKELDDVLRSFTDEQYLILNRTLLPFQGIGENDFFLNESFEKGKSLLDFPTLGDYARDSHRFQQHARHQEDPNFVKQPYRGDLYPCWARLNIDNKFNYANLYSLAAFLNDTIEDTGMKVIDDLIPHNFIQGNNHGKKEKKGTLFDFKVDAGGQEKQLKELQRRHYQYAQERYAHHLDHFDKTSKKEAFIQIIKSVENPHINFIFSDKSALDSIRFRYFYNDFQTMLADTEILDRLISDEKEKVTKFLRLSHEDILKNFDPTVIPIEKKRKIIIADGALDDLL